jgi:hypothetical protein
LEPINLDIKQRLDKLSGPEAEKKKLKNEKDALQKEVDMFFDIKAIDREIKSIQEKLGFSSLNISEEKKLIDKKNRLEALKPKVAKFSKIKDKLDALYKANSSEYDKVKELKDRKKVLTDKLKVITDKLKLIKETTEINNQNIVNLNIQIKSIRDENDKLYQQRRDLEKEWDSKWRKYEDQQHLVKYIDEAMKKINLLKKKDEKEKKRKEKMDKKENNEDDKDRDEVDVQDEVPNAYEIATCQWLTKYFKSLIGETEKQEVKATNVVTNTHTDDTLKPIVRNERDQELGISETQQAKKKGKGPKASKREQKAENTGVLVLDSNIANKIKDVKLTAPVYKKDVYEFLDKLDSSLKNYISGKTNKQVEETKQHKEKANKEEQHNHGHEKFLHEQKHHVEHVPKSGERYHEEPIKNEEKRYEEPIRHEGKRYEEPIRQEEKSQVEQPIRHEQKEYEEPIRHEEKRQIEQPIRQEKRHIEDKYEPKYHHEEVLEEKIPNEKKPFHYEVPHKELKHEERFGERHHEVPIHEEKPYLVKHEKPEEYKKEEPIHIDVGKATKVTQKEPVSCY